MKWHKIIIYCIVCYTYFVCLRWIEFVSYSSKNHVFSTNNLAFKYMICYQNIQSTDHDWYIIFVSFWKQLQDYDDQEDDDKGDNDKGKDINALMIMLLLLCSASGFL